MGMKTSTIKGINTIIAILPKISLFKRVSQSPLFSRLVFVFIFLLTMNGAASGQTNIIIYSFDNDYPPYTFMENGKPVGFDVDIIKAIFNEQKVNIEYRPMQWGDVQQALKEGRVDITSGIVKTEERKKYYDFSSYPLCDFRIALFTTPKTGIREIQDLKNGKIATQRGSYYQKLVEQKGFKPDLYETETEALIALSKGQADAFVGAENTALFNIRKYNLKDIFPVGSPLEASGIYFAVRKGNQDLLSRIDEGMQRINREGTYGRIYRQWFGK